MKRSYLGETVDTTNLSVTLEIAGNAARLEKEARLSVATSEEQSDIKENTVSSSHQTFAD